MKTNLWQKLSFFALAAWLLLGAEAKLRADTKQVAIQNFSFQPSTVTIAPGDTVTWTQMDSAPHTSTSAAAPPVWSSPVLALNQTYSFTFTSAGTYPYLCTVHPFMTASVVVQGAQNNPPTVTIVSPADMTTLTTPANVSLQATATDTDGTIAQVEFFNNSTSLGMGTFDGAVYALTLNNLAAGVYSITAKATDNLSATTTSSPITLTVQNAATNQAPTVVITSPVPGAVFTAPGSFTIQASASDTDGTVAQVEFFSDTNSLGVSTVAPYSLQVTNLLAGPHVLTAVATDNLGAKTTSTPVNITVNQPLTISVSSPAEGTVYAGITNVTLTATTTGGNSTNNSVTFMDGTNTLAVVTNAPYSLVWTNPPNGAHLIIATVTNDVGLSSVSKGIAFVVNTPTVSTQTVANHNFSFIPQALTIQAGQSVQWVQLDATSHTTTSDATPPLWDSGLLALYQTFAFTFTAPGVYPYHCIPHAANPKMHGTITVESLPASPPVASLTKPGRGALYLAPATITLAATASETNGAIDHVEFFAGTTSLGVSTQTPYSLVWSNVAVGSYSLTVKAFDTNNATVVSVAVPITVTPVAAYVQRNLVSDIPGLAEHTDTNLLNPWGIAFSPTSPFWLTDNHTGLSTVYDSTGGVQSLVVTVPPPTNGELPSAPTGIVFNGSTNFTVGSNLPARFIFATEDGTISGWNSGTSVVLKVDNSGSNAIYKGLAIGTQNGNSFLFATDFHNGKVDVFDGNFQPVTVPGAFTDPSLPAGYAPFGIQNVGGQLYVTYALQDANKEDDEGGPGHGYVNVYDLSGTFIKRFAAQGSLNSPWGMTVAPAGFGALSGALLIGNFADGVINGFDLNSGAYLGALQDSMYQPISIPGLWGLSFGNGGRGGDANRLYFAAGIAGDGSLEDHGLFGSLSAVAVAQVAIDSPTNGALFKAPATITVHATAGETPGTVVKVDFYNGSVLLGTVTNAPYTITLTNEPAGSLQLTAQATDSAGEVSVSSVINITVDQVPTITVNSPLEGTVYAGLTNVTLTASTSGGNITNSSVTFMDGTNTLAVVTNEPFSLVWANPPNGAHLIVATIVDGLGLSNVSKGVAFVVNTPTVSTQTVANHNFSFIPQALTIQAGQTVQWVQLDTTGHTTTSDATPPLWDSGLLALYQTFAFTFTAPGVYPYHCIPHAANPKMHGTITVESLPASPPVASLTKPGRGAVYLAPATITLAATASETYGAIDHVEFFADTTSLGVSAQAPYSLVWSNVAAGNYSLTVKAFDTNNATVVSAAVPITVTPVAAYVQRNLVSDIPGLAEHADTNLLNPWGIAFSPTSLFWLTDNHTGLSTVYDSTGGVQSLVVAVPPPTNGDSPSAPTGIVFNGSTNFTVGTNLPARFIFAAEDGTISGWNSGTNAVLKVDNSAFGAIYKGLAIGTRNGSSYLFATDFHNGKIDIFDGNFQPVNLPTPFADASLPAGYAPFGIQNIGGLLYVTYALQDANKEDDEGGPGHGYVNIFDTAGTLIKRFASQGALNSPWGMVVAPEGFGTFSGALLIGNFADGVINGFDLNSGAYLGALQNGTNQPVSIPGLWGLSFGNGGRGGDANRLYFAAGIAGDGSLEDHGLFGSLSAVAVAQVTIVSPTNGTVFNAPATFTVQATATDAFGTVTKVDFYNGSVLLGTVTNAPYTITLTNEPVGTLQLTAKSTGSGGAVVSSSVVNVIIDQPPTVSITSPTNGAVFVGPISLAFAAEASSPQFGIKSLEFYVGNTLLAVVPQNSTSSNAISSINWINVPIGDYSLTVKAIDIYGESSVTAPVTIQVIAEPPLRLDNLARVNNGQFQLTIEGAQMGSTNIVVASTDLIHWSPISTNVVTTKPWTFVDPGATNYSSRFYRVEWLR